MKKQYYILAIISFLLFSCGENGKFSVGDSITKKITIEFDSVSKENNDWHEFNFEKTDGLEVSFSKGTVKGNTYTITAKDYSIDSKPIEVMLSSDLAGTYSFKLIYSKSSETAEVDFENGQSFEFPELIVQAKWKSYIPYFIGLIIIVFGLIVWLLRNRKKANSFDNGFLQISLPKNEQFDLEGKGNIDLAKALEIDDIFCTLYCEPETKLEEDEEIEVKLPRVEIDTDMKMTINGVENMSESAYLKDKDKVIILNSQNDELIKFQYNEF
ncbi:MAG: hypothetical protein KDE33_08090 [Bacteroidetes bacterium]|nr:hypothetical protein [Bacteroidota bacterium]